MILIYFAIWCTRLTLRQSERSVKKKNRCGAKPEMGGLCLKLHECFAEMYRHCNVYGKSVTANIG